MDFSRSLEGGAAGLSCSPSTESASVQRTDPLFFTKDVLNRVENCHLADLELLQGLTKGECPLHAHSQVVAVCSSLLAIAIREVQSEHSSTPIQIMLPDVDVETVRGFVSFIYSGVARGSHDMCAQVSELLDMLCFSGIHVINELEHSLDEGLTAFTDSDNASASTIPDVKEEVDLHSSTAFSESASLVSDESYLASTILREHFLIENTRKKRKIKSHLKTKAKRETVADGQFENDENVDNFDADAPLKRPTKALSKVSKVSSPKDKVRKLKNANASDISVVSSRTSVDAALESEEVVKEIVCNVCLKVFTTRKALRIHKRTHQNLESAALRCDGCEKTLSSKDELKVHLRLHVKVKQFKCDHCEKTFSENSNLQLHMRTHTGFKPFQCDICSLQFSRNSVLRMHVKTHNSSDEKPHVCLALNCGKRFLTAFELVIHTRIHTGEKPYACDVCNKKFTQIPNMIRHKRVHSGEKPYKCTVEDCDRYFADVGSVRKHIRTHTGEKPFTCTTCGNCFSSSSTLTRHVRIHTGEKPYSCPICSKVFSDCSTFKRHTLIHLPPVLLCTICAAGFKRAEQLKTHMSTVHSSTS